MRLNVLANERALNKLCVENVEIWTEGTLRPLVASSLRLDATAQGLRVPSAHMSTFSTHNLYIF